MAAAVEAYWHSEAKSDLSVAFSLESIYRLATGRYLAERLYSNRFDNHLWCGRQASGRLR